jgi:hypothetical protein
MQLNLTAEDQSYIEKKLAEGYQSPESVVSAALALMHESDKKYSAWLREQAEEGLKLWTRDAGWRRRRSSVRTLSDAVASG